MQRDCGGGGGLAATSVALGAGVGLDTDFTYEELVVWDIDVLALIQEKLTYTTVTLSP